MTKEIAKEYLNNLSKTINAIDISAICEVADVVKKAISSNKQIFVCGNGGSAANSNHFVNDLVYGIARRTGGGARAISLSSNNAVMTCLANDVGYDKIFLEQLAVQGEVGDVLIVFSGSGNSPNILNVCTYARENQITVCGFLGYTGGKALSLCDHAVHFNVQDMQISEDLQLVVGHILMKDLCSELAS
ncbi:MAG: phosphoheptose isomerase [Betaproteobacteria bacterium TMED156]|nr:MAG: phosphoheptose isomerase [Betaproteobacteria bacterium TMED156]|tara:strand:- start:1091 stop:1657 length:567 start_codon:yes stop_codon:yes gene_type:complete